MFLYVHRPCVQVVIVCQLKPEAVELLKDLANAPPAFRLFTEWCIHGTEHPQYKGRFKIIGKVDNWDVLSLPGMLKGTGWPIINLDKI